MANPSEKPVVLITGASSGIGAVTVKRFANAGWNIVALARRKERLEELAASLAGVAEVAIVVGDVADREVPAKAVQAAMETFGRLDSLVNNAGAGKWNRVGDTDDDTLDEVIDISLKAPFRFAREALAVMQPGSSIINIGSVFGITSGLAGGAYSTVKAGLIGMTRSLACDYGPQGIRSNLIAPGVIKTEMTDAYWESDYFQRTNHEITPFNREGTADDVANCVFFLASNEGSYLNGQVIALDGGWSTTKYVSPETLAR
ncbi:SDR family NAD(P)-dependent oxidoreductase [Pseudomaricurvus sp. HS19]|uniref:SDR family NAD(P)-dependent oxidoreductase n=1 Tax=Pseudomaricurvus sp. HS19 TaxID=2692626 RepID=UPI001367EB74|nr:SDR family oxidoreductase [Pseudomaricurvus sp. HS19]MYM63894.1 SDR family oxidoreductase [Pseudomaricurvus sp. HS19]